MSNTNALPSERLTVLEVIDPVASSSAITSTYVNVSTNHTLMALLQVGLLNTTGSTSAGSTSGTVDFQLYQATTSSGAGSKVLGTAMTTLTITTTSAGTSKQCIQNVRTAAMDVAGGFDYVAMTVTPGDSVYLSATLFGLDPRMGPGSDQNASTIHQILSS